MKIIFLARRFNPDIGGVEKHVLEVGKRLVKEGNSLTVITQSSGDTKELEGIRVIRMKASGKFAIWKWIFNNRKIIKEADVVHAHDVYFWYFPLRIIYPFKKSYITFHGYESYPIKKRAIYMRKISEKLCNGNIIVGHFIEKWYGTKSNYVIYGGVDIPEEIVKPEYEKSALFFGRLDEQTGVIEYANAVEEIKKIHPDFKFKIVGEGKYLDKLKKYKPGKFKSDLSNEYAKYNFIFVSRYLSILEALAQNREVFALYDNLVKKDYLYMTPFKNMINIASNKDELAEQLEKKLNDKTRIDYRGKIHDYTWENVVSIYLKLWNL